MIDIIKGILIGIANVIPGLSGGTIAVSVGIYDKLIHAVNNIKTDFKGSIKSIWKYGVGMAIGIILSVVLVVKLFEVLPFPTTMLFVGLILGSLPLITSNIKGKKANIIDISLFVIMMAVIVILPMLSSGVQKEFSMSLGGMTILFIIGVIAAATMIIPGVSGSMMLMIMGYYETLTTLISDTIKAALKFNISVCIENVILLIPFAIGVLVGIILIAKLIEYLLKKYRKTVFWAILGLLIASPYGILVKMNATVTFNVQTIACSLIALAVGVFITLKLGESDDKEEKVVKTKKAVRQINENPNKKRSAKKVNKRK